MASSTKAKITPKSRKRKAPEYKTFKLAKRIKNVKKVPGSLKILKQTTKLLVDEKRLFGGIIVVAGFLSFLFVQSFGAQIDLMDLKDSAVSVLGSSASHFAVGLTVLSSLLGSTGSQANEVAGVYRTALTVIVGLAIIWALRQVTAGEKIRVRDAFYLGMYPLVPFLLVLAVVGLQLIPLLLANLLYVAVFTNGLAVEAPEQIIWACAIGLLLTLSLYMVLSSLFALFIVTLPEMTPMKALRSARNLVLHRRLVILVRLVVMFLVLGALTIVVLLPLILFIPGVVEFVFYLFSAFSLVFVIGYAYTLYRELL